MPYVPLARLDWYECLRKKIPLPDDGFELTQSLHKARRGPCLRPERDWRIDPPTIKMQMRERLTADGGASQFPCTLERRRSLGRTRIGRAGGETSGVTKLATFVQEHHGTCKLRHMQ